MNENSINFDQLHEGLKRAIAARNGCLALLANTCSLCGEEKKSKRLFTVPEKDRCFCWSCWVSGAHIDDGDGRPGTFTGDQVVDDGGLF